MTQPARLFRLADDVQGPGLCCDATGLRLAGVALLHKGEDGFTARSSDEIDALLVCAYGDGPDRPRLSDSGLETVARALNQGDLAKAMTAAVFLRLPEPDPNGAARIACADELLAKYDPDQPRDDHGRWTSGGGVASPPPLSTQPPNSSSGSKCEPPVGPAPPGGVVASDHPTDHVPTGYKVDPSHAEDVRRYVQAIVVARQNLDPHSQNYSRDYDNLTQVLDYLDKNKIQVKDRRSSDASDGEADPHGVVTLDMDKIHDLASKLVAQNPGSNPDDILAAYGGATLAHEVRHEIDMAQRWHGQMTSDPHGRLSTELNGYSTAFAVYRGLRLTYNPVFTPAMSQSDIDCRVQEGADKSTATQTKKH